MHLLSKNNTNSLQLWLQELKEFQIDSMFETHILGRAYLYTDSLTLLNSEENAIEYKVGGTSIYQTKIISSEGSIYGSCSCPYDGKCKHIAACLLVAFKSEFR